MLLLIEGAKDGWGRFVYTVKCKNRPSGKCFFLKGRIMVEQIKPYLGLKR